MIQCSQTLPVSLGNSHIFVDTTTLIHASQSDDFRRLLEEIVASGCNLYTISSVIYEFTRSSNTIEGYADRVRFVQELGIIVQSRVEELVGQDSIFTIAYTIACGQRGDKGPSYTDSLLARVAYKYRSSKALIMTANHKDMPLSIFDRKEMIAFDVDGGLRVEAIYALSESSLNNILIKLSAKS